jgi:HrpA-like RNA helicase
MENSSLDTVVLRLKSLGIDNLFTFSYISPPEKQGIETSIETLKVIEALDKCTEITAIGEILLLIPIEPILGRSLIEAVFIE